MTDGASQESACNAGDLAQSLDWEDPLEKGMATHSSILARRIPMDRGAWWDTVHGVTKIQTQLSDKAQHTSLYCRLQINFYHKHNFNLSELEEEN